MPTTRPRHTITETDDVARALAEAAKHWPEAARMPGQLLHHLLEEGYRALREEHRQQADQRRAAIRRTSGAMTGAYGEDYLARLRDEWPE